MSSIFHNTFARSKSGPFLTAGGPVKAYSEVGEKDGLPQDWRHFPEVFAKMTKGKTTAEEYV
jgi:hypothetical protein